LSGWTTTTSRLLAWPEDGILSLDLSAKIRELEDLCTFEKFRMVNEALEDSIK